MSLFSQIKQDWIAHNRDWTRPGFRAVATHRFGVWRMSVKPGILRAPLSILYRYFYRKCRNHYGIELPYTVKLGQRVIFEHQHGIVIHGASEIGDDCIIRQGVTLGNKTLERPHDAPKLGKGVNVGAGAKILGAITIGDGSAIGANAVVLRDVPANSDCCGDPCENNGKATRVNIGVVAIGRNEGERLRACLASARRDCPTVVYVDSGSTDGSANLAKSLGVHVVDLDLSRPFTAARARNEGFEKLREIDSSIEAVQFIDGDCEIIEQWVAKAAVELSVHSKAAVICGRRRERFPDATIYNRLCDMEWDTPIGIAKACGGDALIRVTAFEHVGGYDGTVIAGEEPEMCVRLRQKGWTIHRIDAEMTLHDAAITRFGQWWKRALRSGHAYAQGFAMHGNEGFRKQEVRSIERWTIIPIASVIMATVALAIMAPRWSVLGLVPILLYPMQAGRVAVLRVGRGASFKDAILYGGFLVLGKFPQWLGIHRFKAAYRRGERNAIIEYKGPAESR